AQYRLQAVWFGRAFIRHRRGLRGHRKDSIGSRQPDGSLATRPAGPKESRRSGGGRARCRGCLSIAGSESETSRASLTFPVLPEKFASYRYGVYVRPKPAGVSRAGFFVDAPLPLGWQISHGLSRGGVERDGFLRIETP